MTDAQESDRNLRGVVIGTAGHVDHGKTSLVRALTGVETDRWREERERGLTIDIGFAPLSLAADIETGVVDVPGHEDFLKNMLAGATGIDLLLLVVAADEGPMPQTREHLAIARLLGVSRGVVALTKADRVDEDWLGLAEETTRELLEENGCAGWPIVPVSSTTGDGLDDLADALARASEELEPREVRDLFRMPVDRSFSVHGTGTVVTGTVWSGAVQSGDRVRVLPGDHSSRVRSLEVHGDSRAGVAAGRRCALALVGVDAKAAPRGAVLVTDGSWVPVTRVGVRIETLSRPGRVIEHFQRVRVYVGTRETMARVITLGGATIEPGDSAWAVLVLEEPLVARVRDRGILRFYSPVTTIGGVRICELDPPRSWASRVDGWTSILGDSPEEAFEAAVRLAGPWGFGMESAGITLGRPPAAVEGAAAHTTAVSLGDRWFSEDVLEATMSSVAETVERLHASDRRSPGVSLESVRSAMSGEAAPELVEMCLTRHLDAGTLQATGPRVALPGAGAVLTDAEEAHLKMLGEALVTGGLQPPTVNDLATSLRIQRDVLDDLLRLLVETGAARSITPEIYVDTDALEAATDRVRVLLADGEPAQPSVFKESFSLSRKYLIPLLEYLDRSGVTRRQADGRVLVS